MPFARQVVALASGDSRSPQESRLRLVWVLDAELPQPVCNHEVHDREGRLLGVPDLFDPVAGVVGEYGGRHHAEARQRRSDNAREERFRDHGLEYFEVVEGELASRRSLVGRMHRARARAAFAAPEDRRWVLGPRHVFRAA